MFRFQGGEMMEFEILGKGEEFPRYIIKDDAGNVIVDSIMRYEAEKILFENHETPLNAVEDFEKVIDTIEMMEDYKGTEGWREDYGPQVITAKRELNEYNTTYPKEWYDETKCCGIIYGLGGGNRYYVRASGRVDFSSNHCSNEETIDRARKLGFYIQ